MLLSVFSPVVCQIVDSVLDCLHFVFERLNAARIRRRCCIYCARFRVDFAKFGLSYFVLGLFDPLVGLLHLFLNGFLCLLIGIFDSLLGLFVSSFKLLVLEVHLLLDFRGDFALLLALSFQFLCFDLGMRHLSDLASLLVHSLLLLVQR